MGNSETKCSCGNPTNQQPVKRDNNRRKIEETIEKSVTMKLNVTPDGDDDTDDIDVTDSKISLKMQGRSFSCLNEVEEIAIKVEPSDYEYPFENLVFEGGGNKGLAYCGAMKLLEDLGIDKQIKRYSGASAGAMTAALLAVGYNAEEIKNFLSQDLSHIFLDASFGYLSLLPNLIRGYGWNPGKRIYDWFGEALAKKTKNPDITFSELYRTYQKELCVVVTNLNHMTEEYCHPKTTPDMPIRLAVRMSMAIPGMFQATKYTDKGETNTYVDGGVLCNYPIHCYDGWWLSMKQGDSFLEKLQPLDALPSLLVKKNRFGTFNDKTVGFLLYADSEQDIYRSSLEKRIGSELPEEPIDTKLYKDYKEKKKLQEVAKKEHRRTTMAVDAFLKVLKRSNLDRDHKIDRKELENAFKDAEFTDSHRKRLFGDDISVDDAFKALDADGNGEIHYHELVHFIETRGILLQQRFLGYQRKDISGFLSFLNTLQSTLLTNVKRVFVEEHDLDRTVGINTGHVGTTDFKLEKADMDFVIEQGRRSTLSFLKYYVATNPDKVKKKVTTPVVDETVTENDIDITVDSRQELDEKTALIQNGNT